jgi:hypothetical protein
MIWYRHWLELRYWLIVVLGCTGIATAVAGLVSFVNPEPYDAAWLVREWPQLADRLPEMGSIGFLIWAYHVDTAGTLSLFCCFCLVGWSAGSRQQIAIYHTLSMPVPRARWIWTRLVMTIGVVAAANLVLLVSQLALALATGRSAPWPALAAASIAATIAGAAYLSIMQLSRWIAPWWIAFIVFLPVFLAPPNMRLLATWSPLTIGLATAGLIAFAVTPLVATRRDY